MSNKCCFLKELITNDSKLYETNLLWNFFLFESFQEQIRDHVNDFQEFKWKVNF